MVNLALLLVLALVSGYAVGGVTDSSDPCAGNTAADDRPDRERRPFAVHDAIEMVRVKAPGLDESPFVWSPGHEAVAFVLQQGHLDTNEVEYTIAYYTREDLQTAASGTAQKCHWRVAASFRSQTNAEGVAKIMWLDGGDTLAALAQDADGIQQLYRIDLRRERVEQLTNHPTSIQQFDMVGERFVYIAESDRTRPSEGEPWRGGFNLGAQTSMTDIYRTALGGTSPTTGEIEIFTGDASRDRRAIRVDVGGPVSIMQPVRGIWMSPDGRYAVTILPPRGIPAAWESYDIAQAGFELTATRPGETVDHIAWQYVVLDLESAGIHKRIDAPAGWHLGFRAPMQAFWSEDSALAILTNTYLPWEIADERERERRLAGASTAALEIESGDLWRVAALPGVQEGRIGAFSWDAEHAVLVMESYPHDDTMRTLAFDAATGQETDPASGEHLLAPMHLAVEQTLNLAPRLSLKAEGGEPLVLSELNPDWAPLEIPEARAFNWTDASGYEWHGVLVEPLDYEPGRRYPLVIQTHGVSPEAFIVDGPIPGVTTTAYAARPLASAGMFVLQMEDRRDVIMTPDEAPAHMRGYLGAIETLDDAGLIDTSRVGLLGFSRTCYHVKYALAFSDFPFAAATVADGVDMGYLQYILYSLRNPAIRREFEALHGGIPVADDITTWIERAPSFNVQNIETPLRIEGLGPESVLSQWEMYALLRRLDRPVEMIYIPDGVHNLVKPWERMKSQQGNVDWFSYWLMDRKGQDLDKPDQYRRWDELKALIDNGP